jgi:hypothetical protein
MVEGITKAKRTDRVEIPSASDTPASSPKGPVEASLGLNTRANSFLDKVIVRAYKAGGGVTFVSKGLTLKSSVLVNLTFGSQNIDRALIG